MLAVPHSEVPLGFIGTKTEGVMEKFGTGAE
jgi:hypothetical protein